VLNGPLGARHDARERCFWRTDIAPLAVLVLDGFNVCIFAYAQTGSGKTHTTECSPVEPGVNWRALAALFQIREDRREQRSASSSASRCSRSSTARRCATCWRAPARRTLSSCAWRATAPSSPGPRRVACRVDGRRAAGSGCRASTTRVGLHNTITFRCSLAWRCPRSRRRCSLSHACLGDRAWRCSFGSTAAARSTAQGARREPRFRCSARSLAGPQQARSPRHRRRHVSG
jgi:hypothetical protein